MRSWLPSLFGFTPRSESRIAFSIALICEVSYGLMITIRGSGIADRGHLRQRGRACRSSR